MSHYIKPLALPVGAIVALCFSSCAPAPTYYQAPDVHNVTIVEKPTPKPKPKPRTPTETPESFRAVF